MALMIPEYTERDTAFSDVYVRVRIIREGRDLHNNRVIEFVAERKVTTEKRTMEGNIVNGEFWAAVGPRERVAQIDIEQPWHHQLYAHLRASDPIFANAVDA
jgi:hypothetical protein